MKSYRIACIPGDGIGKEVVPAGQAVLEALAGAQRGFRFEFSTFGWGGDWYRAHGEMMPAAGLDALRQMDAILFGSAGDPHIPDHITLWGLRLKICQGFDQYANVRPTRILPGIDGPLKRCQPADLDWVIVRENSEGEYSGVGGRVHQGHPIEAATDVCMMTRAGVERIMRFAFRLAQSRPRKLLTVVTKSNAQRHAMVMWDEIAGSDRPGVPRRQMGQGTGGRLHGADGQPPGLAGHRGRHQPARRHPERPGGRAGRQPGHRPPPPTSIPSGAIPRCSSLSMARLSTSWARAWPTRSARSGAA